MDPLTRRLTLDSHLPPDFLSRALRVDARRGLSATPKFLPPKWCVDEHGGRLFDEITRLPDYYPTRAEREILLARAPEIAALSRAETLVELACGAGDKTRLLIEALLGVGTVRTYVPVDVSPAGLLECGRLLIRDYPTLEVHALLADFEHQLDVLPVRGTRLTALLGGTIGSLEPEPRAEFLAALREGTATGDWLLLGTDLVKDPAVLVAAYDDATGVTADFNRNALRVVNRELGADFDVDAFEHVAVWDAEREWVETRLRSTSDVTVAVPGIELSVAFHAGEELRTAVSAKFRPGGVAAELAAAGFVRQAGWTDSRGRFLLTLAEAR